MSNKCHFKCNMEGGHKGMVTLRAPRYLALISSCLVFSVGFSESAFCKRTVKGWYKNQNQPLVPTSFKDNNVELNIYNLFLTTFGQTLPLYRNNVNAFLSILHSTLQQSFNSPRCSILCCMFCSCA